MTGAFAAAASDIGAGLARFELWRYLAMQDIRARYTRSLLGPFWITASMAVWVVAMTLVFGGLFGAPLSVIAPYISAGIILWTFLSAVFNESAACLIAYRGYILQSEIPTTTFVFLIMFRNLLVAAHHMAVLAVVLVVFEVWPNAHFFWLLIGLPLFLATCFGASLILALLTPRIRDLGPAVTSIMTIGFFLTPVMWRPSDLQKNDFIITINPFAHLLAVVRDPLLGAAPSMLSIQVAAACAAVTLAVGFAVLAATRKRVAFWL